MMMYRYGSRTGFLGVLVPSVSVKDRAVVGPADHGIRLQSCLCKCKSCKLFMYLNSVCKTYCFVFIEFIFSSNMPCLYHLRPPSRGTTGDVSIGPWVEKGSPN